MNNRTCPLCRGEGRLNGDYGVYAVPAKKSFLEQLEGILPKDWGSWFTLTIFILCITGLLYSLITAPPRPETKSPERQCAEACGIGRFKSFTYPSTYWEEPDGSKYGKHHPPEPQRCECILPGETP